MSFELVEFTVTFPDCNALWEEVVSVVASLHLCRSVAAPRVKHFAAMENAVIPWLLQSFCTAWNIAEQDQKSRRRT